MARFMPLLQTRPERWTGCSPGPSPCTSCTRGPRPSRSRPCWSARSLGALSCGRPFRRGDRPFRRRQRSDSRPKFKWHRLKQASAMSGSRATYSPPAYLNLAHEHFLTFKMPLNTTTIFRKWNANTVFYFILKVKTNRSMRYLYWHANKRVVHPWVKAIMQ